MVTRILNGIREHGYRIFFFSFSPFFFSRQLSLSLSRYVTIIPYTWQPPSKVHSPPLSYENRKIFLCYVQGVRGRWIERYFLLKNEMILSLTEYYQTSYHFTLLNTSTKYFTNTLASKSCNGNLRAIIYNIFCENLCFIYSGRLMFLNLRIFLRLSLADPP